MRPNAHNIGEPFRQVYEAALRLQENWTTESEDRLRSAIRRALAQSYSPAEIAVESYLGLDTIQRLVPETEILTDGWEFSWAAESDMRGSNTSPTRPSEPSDRSPLLDDESRSVPRPTGVTLRLFGIERQLLGVIPAGTNAVQLLFHHTGCDGFGRNDDRLPHVYLDGSDSPAVFDTTQVLGSADSEITVFSYHGCVRTSVRIVADSDHEDYVIAL